MNLLQIVKQVNEYINKEPVEYDLEQANKWLDIGIDTMLRYCPHPGCKHRGIFKNHRGVRIHMAKVHGWTKAKEQEYILKHLELAPQKVDNETVGT